MSYLSLARKYRPNTFADLVGQESVGLALANAIRLKREPRGVIFTGVRGIGKTTTARIYAKALNCENGPLPEPCNTCPSCLAIQQGVHEDVLEIDGASNTGVDDVRALQETLAYVPQRSTFKIYIIDEVHMLSVSAFNALLKTLEEPPEHVVFIFATTELHKVPETIQSRCQIFHLQKISTQLTRKRIAAILESEAIPFEDRAIQWIAREGKGSLRDALTLLDQVIAVGGGSVQWSAVEPMVNTGHAEPIYELLSLLLSRNATGLLEVIARWDQEGLAMTILVEELVKACRNAFILKSLKPSSSEVDILDLEEREMEALLKVGQEAQVLDLNRIFRSFVKCLDDLRNSELDRFVVENYALEWCLDPGLPDLTTLLQGSSLSNGAKPQVAPSMRAAPPSSHQGTAAAPSAQPVGESASAPKVAAPPMDLRNRWKQTQTTGQAPAPTKVEAPPPISASKPMATTAASAARAEAPSLEMKIGASVAPSLAPVKPVETKVSAPATSTDHQAAQTIAQNHGSSLSPQQGETASSRSLPKVAPVAPSSAPSPIVPTSTPPATAAASIARERQGAQMNPPKAEDDELPPWLSEDAEDFESEELSIISQISAQKPSAAEPKPAPALTPPVVKLEPSPSSVSPQQRLESLLKPAPAPIKEKAPEAPAALSVAELPVDSSWPATWKDFVDEWKKKKPLQARVLEETYALEYSPGRIKLAVESESLAGQKLLHFDTRKKLVSHFEALFGFKGIFEVIPKSELSLQEAPQETLLETKQKVQALAREDLKDLLEKHPLTQEALSEFGGTIESIEVQ